MTLWGAAAGLAVVALGLVLVAGGGGDDDAGDSAGNLPTLPIGSDGGGAGESADTRSASAQDMSILPASTYVPGEGLPALGGNAPAYRLDAQPTRDDVARLADALGIEGEPTELDGSWHVEDDEQALDVYGREGSWSTYSMSGAFGRDPGAGPAIDLPAEIDADARADAGADPGAGSSGQPGSAPADGSSSSSSANVSASAEAGDTPTSPAAPDVAVAPPPDQLCPTYVPGDDPGDDEVAARDEIAPCDDPLPIEPYEPPVRPANLPSEDEARTIALDLLTEAGADVDGAKVTVDDGITEWFVSVEPRLGDLPAPGLTMYVGVGDEGVVTSASGLLVEPEKLGDYPLLDTTEALERLNEQRVYLGPAVDPAVTPLPADETTVEGQSAPARDPGDDLPVLPEPETAPMTVPVEAPPDVAVTDAEIVLLTEFAWDGSGSYLVPGYRFTADDDTGPTVTAVEEDLIEPPPSPEPLPQPLPADPGDPTEPVPPVDPGEPKPLEPEVEVGQAQPGTEPTEPRPDNPDPRPMAPPTSVAG